jgi:hypothetical protein
MPPAVEIAPFGSVHPQSASVEPGKLSIHSGRYVGSYPQLPSQGSEGIVRVDTVGEQ